MYYADPPAAPPQFPPPPPGGPVPSHQGLAPVLVAFPGPAPQSRGTVAIRILLAIPHLIVLYALGVAAEVIAIIGWFGALFTGHLPEFAAEFLTGYLRWQTRVYAYLALLTDEYPPFALTDGPYPIRIATLPGTLNRLAVLFRFILIIPAGLVVMVLSYGAFTIVAFVTWLIVLITGRMPDALYQALAAALRYYTRVSGYLLMLTSAYPGGLFGDPPPGPAYDPAFPPAPRLAAPANPWILVLSSAARRLVGWFLAIGVVLVAGLIALIVVAGGNAAKTVSARMAADQMQSAANSFNAGLQSAANASKSCGRNLSCVTRIDAQLASAYTALGHATQSIAMPSSQDSAAAATIAADAAKVAGTYTRMSQATSVSQFDSIVNSSGVQTDIGTLRTAFNSLQTTLAGS
jgi:Domain of unknown function (DUF4389)